MGSLLTLSMRRKLKIGSGKTHIPTNLQWLPKYKKGRGPKKRIEELEVTEIYVRKTEKTLVESQDKSLKLLKTNYSRRSKVMVNMVKEAI